MSTFYFTIRVRMLEEGMRYSLQLLGGVLKDFREEIREGLYVMKHSYGFQDDYIYMKIGFDSPFDVLKTLEDIKEASFTDACVYDYCSRVGKQSPVLVEQE